MRLKFTKIIETLKTIAINSSISAVRNYEIIQICSEIYRINCQTVYFGKRDIQPKSHATACCSVRSRVIMRLERDIQSSVVKNLVQKHMLFSSEYDS